MYFEITKDFLNFLISSSDVFLRLQWWQTMNIVPLCKILMLHWKPSTLLRHLFVRYALECFWLDIHKTVFSLVSYSLTLNISLISSTKTTKNLKELHLHMKKICFIYLEKHKPHQWTLWHGLSIKKNSCGTFNVSVHGTKPQVCSSWRKQREMYVCVCVSVWKWFSSWVWCSVHSTDSVCSGADGSFIWKKKLNIDCKSFKMC